jgi:RNA polymerase sigma factor for flagellar operon FliA
MANSLGERDALVAEYSHLVPITAGHTAKRLPPSIDRDDLVSSGYLGLLKAATQFDPRRGVPFRTYAISLIRGAILEMLREGDWVPRLVRDNAKALEKAVIVLEKRLHRPPTETEIADALGIALETLTEWRRLIHRATAYSLESIVAPGARENHEAIRLMDVLRDEALSPQEEAEAEERRRLLMQAITCLPEREMQVVRLYYGNGLTFRRIGERLGYSESRAYQLNQQALARLRQYLGGSDV